APGPSAATSANVRETIFAAAQAEIGSLLTRLTRTGLLDELAGLLVRALFLRARRPGLWWTEVEIGRHLQRRARFNRELVGRCLFQPDCPLQIAAALKQQSRRTESGACKKSAPGDSQPIRARHGTNPSQVLI